MMSYEMRRQNNNKNVTKHVVLCWRESDEPGYVSDAHRGIREIGVRQVSEQHWVSRVRRARVAIDLHDSEVYIWIYSGYIFYR